VSPETLFLAKYKQEVARYEEGDNTVQIVSTDGSGTLNTVEVSRVNYQELAVRQSVKRGSCASWKIALWGDLPSLAVMMRAHSIQMSVADSLNQDLRAVGPQTITCNDTSVVKALVDRWVSHFYRHHHRRCCVALALVIVVVVLLLLLFLPLLLSSCLCLVPLMFSLKSPTLICSSTFHQDEW
jgi:hypothetical protein